MKQSEVKITSTKNRRKRSKNSKLFRYVQRY